MAEYRTAPAPRFRRPRLERRNGEAMFTVTAFGRYFYWKLLRGES